MLKPEYVKQIKTLASDIGSVVELDSVEYKAKIRRLLYRMPIDEIDFPETVFLLCKGIKDEIEGTN